MRLRRRILQIIPAQDWFAVRVDDDSKHRWLWPLSCWALIENERGGTQVIGLDAHGDAEANFSEDTGKFLGYVHRSGPKRAETFSEQTQPCEVKGSDA